MSAKATAPIVSTAAAPVIQLDMFEVQLGSSILLQFKCNDGSLVRVLADAGVLATGYKDDHVLKKLRPAILGAVPSVPTRIDLIIGTHYDADHLIGLVPIVQNKGYEFGEAWLPPIINDAAPPPKNVSGMRNLAPAPDRLADKQAPALLAEQLYSDASSDTLRKYLEHRNEICARCDALLDQIESTNKRVGVRALRSEAKLPVQELAAASLPFDVADKEKLLEKARSHFDKFKRSRRFPGAEALQNRRALIAPHQVVAPSIGTVVSIRSIIKKLESPKDFRMLADKIRAASPQQQEKLHTVLAAISASSADKAITAVHLAKLVQALKARKIPMSSQTIAAGTPRHFAWNPAKRAFTETNTQSTLSPSLVLLGPSNELVDKYRKQVPVGTYLALAPQKLITIESIKPSNQLSYVIRFSHAGRNILIVGDAGCVDFQPKPRVPYYPALLGQMSPIDIVQVAHHAGNNAHFYRVLLQSRFAVGAQGPYLLISHATDDDTRPSERFKQFLEELGCSAIRLLFTGRPAASRQATYRPYLYPAVPPNASADRGDVRMVFDGKAWKVTAHAVTF